MTVATVDVNGESVRAITVRDIAEHDWSRAAVRRYLGGNGNHAASERTFTASDGVAVPGNVERGPDDPLRRLNTSLERQARRIAQALHDEAGQLLTSAHIALNDIGDDLPASARAQVDVVKRQLDRIEDQLRRVAHELHAVRVNASLPPMLPPLVAATVYRVVQEALTNIVRHARAKRILIVVEHSSGTLRCIVEDDGIGFSPSTMDHRGGDKGLGIDGIRDQVEALGGSVDIDSAPARGTRLTVRIPVEQ